MKTVTIEYTTVYFQTVQVPDDFDLAPEDWTDWAYEAFEYPKVEDLDFQAQSLEVNGKLIEL